MDGNSNPEGSHNHYRLSEQELSQREDYLRNTLGLNQIKIDQIKSFQPRLCSIQTVEECFQGLQDRGFTNPRKMIESCSAILFLSSDNIDAKIQGLQDRGFTDPRKMITHFPATLTYSFDNIDAKIQGLQDRGFTDSHKMIEKEPAVLSYSFDNIDAKIQGLQDRGFTNPHKMIERSLSILGYSFDNIDAKIQGLQDRGFNSPHKMIESSPQILDLSFKNIDAKIRLLTVLNKIYQLGLNPTQTIESNLPILGTKFEKLIVIARIVREYQPSAPNVQRKIGELFRTNLESLILSYSEKKDWDTLDDLMKKAASIQKQKLPKQHKRDLIKGFFNNHQDSYKIYRDYLRGYPDQEAA
jgi:hypothetical protein